MATERTVLIRVSGTERHAGMPVERQVSVPWCVEHDAQGEGDGRCILNEYDSHRHKDCDIQDGEVWKVVRDD